VEDVKEGVIASRIAAHAADIVKGIKGAKEWNEQMSRARRALDWETQAKLSLDTELSQQIHSKIPAEGATCSMCGKYCAMAIIEKYLDISAAKC
jgi:phosphomethylpyrimidine synthase